ncbi:uncharacterized protein LOC135477167 [Liolophura sinensis]|uniref:uncharacterized protein LOC135477167 n=1 Tax=Liolophura sinensis TaxID=3198878 RepID=UPI0031587D43
MGLPDHRVLPNGPPKARLIMGLRPIVLVMILVLLGLGALCVIYTRSSKLQPIWITPTRYRDLKYTLRDHRNFTIVSAYFNLGTLRKGFKTTLSPGLYRQWASFLTRILNPLVFYTDDVEFKALIESGRAHLPNLTKVIYVKKRETFWAFSLRDKIQRIYDDPKYPKYYPGTVSADYSCVQHVKYELITDVLNRNIFPARYYAWLDAGYFRGISGSNAQYRLDVPHDFDDSRIAYTEIKRPKSKLSFHSVIVRNKLWVGGGMFIGTAQKLRGFFMQYQRAVELSLRLGIMNVDQTILCAMFTENGRKLVQPSVEVQPYRPPKGHNPWFYLGYRCLWRVKSTRDQDIGTMI